MIKQEWLGPVDIQPQFHAIETKGTASAFHSSPDRGPTGLGKILDLLGKNEDNSVCPAFRDKKQQNVKFGRTERWRKSSRGHSSD